LVIVLPLALLIVASVNYLVGLGALLNRHIAPILSQAVSTSLNRDVHIGSIDAFSVPGIVVVHNVTIANHLFGVASPTNLPALTASTATVHYDLPGIVAHPALAASMIQAIRIDGANVLVERYPHNRFNFSSFIQNNKKTPSAPFKALITVASGRATYVDYTANGLSDTVKITGASFDCRSDRLMKFSADGISASHSFRSLKLDGSLLRTDTAETSALPGGFTLTIHVDWADPARAFRYAVPGASRYASLAGGHAQGDLSISSSGQGRKHAVIVQAHALVVGTTVTVRDLALLKAPIKNASATVDYAGQVVEVDGHGEVAGASVGVTGAILGFKKPMLACRVTGTNVDYVRLHNTALPILPPLPAFVSSISPGTATVVVTGNLIKPNLVILARTPTVAARGFVAHGVELAGSYAQGTFTVDHATADGPVAGSTIVATGILGKSAREGLQIAVDARHIPLKSFVGFLPKHAIWPQDSGDISLRGDIVGTKPNTVSVQAQVATSTVRFHGLAFGRSDAIVAYSKSDGLRLSRAVVRDTSNGVMSVGGSVPINPSDRWNLQTAFTDVHLGSSFPSLAMRGAASGSVAVAGYRDSPEFSGQLQVRSVEYAKWSADLMQGTFTYAHDQLNVPRLVVRRFPLEASASLQISGLSTKTPIVALAANLDKAQAADLEAAVGDVFSTQLAKQFPKGLPDVSGAVAVKLAATGPLADLDVSVDTTGRDIRVDNLDIPNVTAKIEYKRDVVSVQTASGTALGAEIAGTGAFDTKLQQIISSNIHIAGLSLADAAAYSHFSVPVDGSANLDITASGPLDRPDVHASIVSAGQVSAYGVALSSLKLGVNYDGSTFSDDGTDAVIASGDATYTLHSFTYAVESKALTANVQVSDESLQRIARIIQTDNDIPVAVSERVGTILAKMPQPLTGTITIPELDLSGTTTEPSVKGTVSLSDFEMGPVRLKKIDGAGGYAGGDMTLTSLKSSDGDIYMEAHGAIAAHGPINASLEASNIPMSWVAAFAHTNEAVAGSIADLTVVASGESASPDVEASLTLDHPSYGQFNVDRIDSGRISIKNQQITVNGLSVLKSDTDGVGKTTAHVALLRGSVPFQWGTNGEIAPSFPTDVPFNLTITVPSQSLGILTMFAPQVKQYVQSGIVQGDVAVAGTLADKRLSGSLSIADATVAMPGLKTGLKDVDATLSLDHNTVDLTHFGASSSVSGSISGTGSATLGGARPVASRGIADALFGGVDLNLHFTAKNFKIDEKKIAALYDAGFTGVVNGGVDVASNPLRPTVSGAITVSDVVGVLPAVPSTQSEEEAVPVVNPKFDVTIAVAEGSRLHSASIDALTDGKVSLSGSLEQPRLVANLSLRKGTFKFPTAVFKIVPVGSVDIDYAPPDIENETVNIAATTNIDVAPSIQTISSANALGPAGAGLQNAVFTGQQASQRYKITTTITGPLNDPAHLNVQFQSDPPGLTDNQILATIGGQAFLQSATRGDITDAVKNQVQYMFTNSMLPQLMAPVEANVSQVLGLEDFSVDYSPQSPLQVTLVKRLADRLSVTFLRLLMARSPGAVAETLGPEQYQLELDYSITNRIRLGVSTDDQRNNTISLDGVLNF
jgi:autotransporter translocation and assembly factor TamB